MVWYELWEGAGKLSATAVKAATELGRYGDGDGLFLMIDKRGGNSWMVRVQKDGKRRDIGLGSVAKVPLKLARHRAAKVREQVEAGVDPVAERRRAAGNPTFREAAKLVHAEHKAAVALFQRMREHKREDSDLVFPGTGRGKPLSDMTLVPCSSDTTVIQRSAR